MADTRKKAVGCVDIWCVQDHQPHSAIYQKRGIKWKKERIVGGEKAH